MRYQILVYRLREILLVGVCIIVMPLFVAAQDEPPAPQFLYRSANHLVLLNGYTGTTTTLPIDVTERDRFIWSPDGQYLLAKLYQGENNGSCLNLYDVDQQKWAYDKPISCAARDTIFSNESERIFYTTDDKTNVILWMYSSIDETSHEVYRTTYGDEHYPARISELNWSPTGAYLTFISDKLIMGGALNTFVVMNAKDEKYITLSAPDSYYASYYPIWSADDQWFLIILKEEYSMTNHQGDVYLVHSETGKSYRLTYTPAASEVDIHWTDNGEIAFTEVTETKFTYALDQAINIEAIPVDKIIMPEPFDRGTVTYSTAGIFISPDPNLAAWVGKALQADMTFKFALNIGDLPFYSTSVTQFSIPISDPDKDGTILIGWRPSDYPYSQD